MLTGVFRRSLKLGAPLLSRVSASSLKVFHNDADREFYIQLDKGAKAQLLYSEVEPQLWDMYSTRVPDEFSGRGIAAQLAKVAFEEASGRNARVLLTCSYLRDYVQKHPEYQKLMVPLGHAINDI